VAWLSYLTVIWYGLFLLGPLGLVTTTAFAHRGTYGSVEWHFSFENFIRAFDSLYLRILGKSLWLALLTTALCLAIGLPMAFSMATSSKPRRRLWVFLLAVPFLTNLVIRLYALKLFTSYDGALARLLQALRVEFDPFSLSQNTTLVFFGMLSTYLPFMVFPLYSALERFDFSLVEAAQDLGADWPRIFTRVIIPSLKKATGSGILLVFIPSLGEFLIPDLLGGARTMLTGNLITEQFLKARDWPFGSALAVLFIALLLAGIAVFSQLTEPRQSQEVADV
jgi:spermidine/putrescine transport system permease protein